ncbi:MAG: tetratricopeptide repeat protein [Acidobacteriota bacterium]
MVSHVITLRGPFVASLLAVLLALPARAGGGHYGPLPLRKKDRLLVEKSTEFEELIERRGGLYPEGEVTELVRRVGAAIAPEHPADDYQRFRFGVVRDPVPNAFALPDGQIYVNSGLLALLENEAQLAAVLAHECMHVEGHHSVIHARQARKKSGAMVALGIGLGTVGNLINIALLRSVIGFGRNLEEEADYHAFPRLLEAGYDPRELPRIFELLDLDPEGERSKPKPKWASHPLARARTAAAEQLIALRQDEIRAATEKHGELRIGADHYPVTVREAAVHAIERLLEADRPRTALLLARRQVDLWPDDAAAQARLGDAHRLLDARTIEPTDVELSKRGKRRKREGRVLQTAEERREERLQRRGADDVLTTNRETALAAYERALELDPSCPEALRGRGYLQRDAGRWLDAGRDFAAYLRARPDAADRSRITALLAEITRELETSR